MASTKTQSVDDLIKKALIRLLNNKSYMDITVSDLVKEAGVARASFYRNFNSTNDVLDRIIEDMANNFIETLVPILSNNDIDLWREFLFNFIYNFRSCQKSLVINNPSNVYIILFKLNNLFSLMQKEQNFSDIKDKYRINARFGLIHMVLKGWIDSGMQESPEQLVNYLMDLITLI